MAPFQFLFLPPPPPHLFYFLFSFLFFSLLSSPLLSGLCSLSFSMASLGIKPGVPLMLRELQPSSPFFKHGQSLRLTGKLEAYHVENRIAVISDGVVTLKVNTRNLTDLTFCIGSWYQFIGELVIGLDSNDMLLQARVGRIVDGLDLNLYQQSLHLSRNLMGWI